MGDTTNRVRFLLNNKLITIDQELDPTLSVLNYLRQNQRMTGTKEGCAEGDCGACTVVIGELVNNKLQMRAINACIRFVSTLDGKALFTIEYLRRKNKHLHPVQQAMVDHHGSQCGFCTPGFVMSMWSLYVNHQAHKTQPDNTQIRSALSGNLCRCTGYRSIIKAAEEMSNYDAVKFGWSSLKNKLIDLQRPSPLRYQYDSISFDAPKTLDQLCLLRSQKPKATLLAGSTDIGLWVNKQFRDLGDIIYLGEVSELKRLQEDTHNLIIGAGVSLSDAYRFIAQHYPEINQQWERFASKPIRNAGTLGGNVANGSPIGDSMPWLIVLGASVILRNQATQRTLRLEGLYVDYMKQAMHADEVVEAIIVPKPVPNQIFRTYKLSKRYDSDISAVCAAFRILLDDQSIISACKIAFGGMAATPKRAHETEQLMIGKPWNEATARQAMQTLSADYSPLSDMRASAKNRLLSAQNLLYRFHLETRPHKPVSADSLTVFN